MTGQLLMRGTTKRTRQQIQDELDKLKARMFVGGGATGATVNIETIAANLPAVLELANEVLREPSFPQVELDTLRQQALAGMENQKSEPQAVTMRAFQQHLSPYPKGDVRYVPSLDEEMADLKSLTLDQVKQFHSNFYGGSNAEIAIVGDFEPEVAMKIVSSGIGTWKSPKPYTRVRNPYQKIEPVSRVFETPDKTNAFFLAGTRINISDESPDYPAILFANYLLGQGINSRLFARIRGKEGLSYGIGSSLSVAPTDDSAMFVTNAISAPENAAKVEASFRDEIAVAAQGRIQRRGDRGGQSQLAAESAAQSRSECGAGGPPRRPGALRPDDGLGRRAGEEGAGADVAADLGGDAEVLRPVHLDVHEGRRFQKGRRDCEAVMSVRGRLKPDPTTIARPRWRAGAASSRCRPARRSRPSRRARRARDGRAR